MTGIRMTDTDTGLVMDMENDIDTDDGHAVQCRERKFNLHNIKRVQHMQNFHGNLQVQHMQNFYGNHADLRYCSVRKLFMCGGAPSAIQKA